MINENGELAAWLLEKLLVNLNHFSMGSFTSICYEDCSALEDVGTGNRLELRHRRFYIDGVGIDLI